VRDATVRRLSQVHAAVFRWSGGRLGRRMAANDILLLTSTGRRSGDRHTVPLLYLGNGERLVVFASFGGRDVHPDWYRNLLADPAAEVELPGRRLRVTAETVVGTERDRLWERAVAAYPAYAAYQRRTEREIPVVMLRPGAAV